jgi:predicted esterase
VKSGNYKMMNRDYTVDVGANYDANKPSRLVFAMHCMGSSRQGVINDQYYYQLKPKDTDKNTIFVAMQGESDGTWQQGANDHKMFEDIHKHLSANMCIDSSRVFSVGFNFGAMFTNSLSRNHQGLLRAVVTFAPADYNIYLPPTTIDAPIGAMITVGLGDGTCPPKTARSCRDLKVKHNKCTVPATVTETTTGSGTHVCYDYQGCGNYPVKFCTFDGGHDDRPKDRNASATWTLPLAWDFIKQF